MKRVVISAIITMCVKVLVLTTVVGIVVAFIGNKNAWDTPMAYSNAFFIAGALVIIAGASSRLAASQERGAFLSVYAESFRHMSSSEKADYIVNISSSMSALILGVSSGILLIIISAILTKFE